ncbi:Pyridoxamine-phosphate oxidase [Paraburkholderia piptadeniae]|uniref:Pyridoxamine-phosphate oxidase n=1 Tax=Paraburkholderia piptadeniae TaxID=1701573 RepID=A0A1N7RWL0_9BURK|nr:pyridoxamine 5'-phosphate oxidase family protein [Paraburkholderia piptadeniae]SIT39468.1 Pyridoxamine-phosphate oxidase [Paraburkholderia piptadeniae]
MDTQAQRAHEPEPLAAVFDKIWDHLYAGANARQERSAYTMMQLATIGRDGLPKLRTVVLRRAVKERALLTFHTDLRSEKVREIERQPHVALLSSDVQAGIQIRLEGVACPVADENARMTVWNSSRPGTLILYQAPLVPGSPIAAPSDATPSPDDAASTHTAGFRNFCLMDVGIQRIGYLDVSGVVHNRAQFCLEGGHWCGQWVAP